MAQHDRKNRERGSAEENRDQQSLQRPRGRNESLSRDPFTAIFGGRDPFAAFWEPFRLATRDAWQFRTGREGGGLWTPQIETFQRGNEFVVRADLPGLSRDDVKVDVTDDSITLQGERREEHEEDREGYYRSERTYGSFYRVVPLPEGALTDSAKAQFNNGVLEIVLQAPPKEISRGRRLEISETANSTRTETTNQHRGEREKAETQR